MKKMLSVVAYCFLFFSFDVVYAQKVPSIELDAAAFKYDKDNILWELYYAFPDTAISYQVKDGKYVGELYMKVEIQSQSKTVVSKQWIASSVSDSAITSFSHHLTGLKQFVLPPGQYTASFTIADYTHMQDSIHKIIPLIISTSSDNQLAISDIELASDIGDADASSGNSTFTKGPLAVVPNPTLVYNDTVPIVKYYAEIYNGKKYAPGGLQIRYAVFDAARHNVMTLVKKRSSNSDAIIDYGAIAVDTLPSGVYYLQITVMSAIESAVDSASSIKKFFVVNPQREPTLHTASESSEFQTSEFSALTADQIQREYEQSKIIASLPEQDLYQKLTDNTARQKFLFQFWNRRDPKPETPVNERRQEFLKAIDYANKFFASLNHKEGWQSDRGHILLKYGFPDEVERKTFHEEGKPYERWTYTQIQGGVEFCFVDMSGASNYVLVHSTAQNELRDDDWYNRYVQLAGSSNNQDIRR